MSEEPAARRIRKRFAARTTYLFPTAQSSTSLVAFALLLGGAAVALFLAGGAEQGNLGVFLLCAGLALLIGQPRARISPSTGLAAGLFLGCSAAALLPGRWFPAPLWRQRLANLPDLPLPTTVSAAPALTLFWLAILAVTVLVGLFTLTQPVRSRPLLGFALAAASVCGVYAGLSIFAKLSGWTYPFAGGASFGFLPNRNHTATLLITGSLVSVGILGVAFRERRWLAVDVAVAALVLCVVGLFFFSESRAGVLFLCSGVVVWFAGLGGRNRSRPLRLAFLVVGITAASLFLLIKSEARDRLFRSIPVGQIDPVAATSQTVASLPPKPGGGISADDRLRIYRDTLGMIRDAPWTGTGLGTFERVFPFYRRASASTSLVVHPESDWLMVAAETGLPALACLAWLVCQTLRNGRRSPEHPSFPLRWGLLVAAGTAAAHGLVDVPAHRLAVGWWTLVLAGLALQPGSGSGAASAPDAPTWKTRLPFALGGLLALGLGGTLVRAQWLGGPPSPPAAVAAAQKTIAAHMDRQDFPQALVLARQAARTFPLVPGFDYQLGLLLVRDTDNDAQTDQAFRTERELDPLTPNVPRLQSLAWMPFDPDRTATLLADALARQEKLPPGALGAEAPAAYLRDLVAQATLAPQVQRLLWNAASGRGPRFVLAWLEGANPEVARERLPQLALDNSFLGRLTPDEKQRFVAVWSTKGDAAALRAFLEARHPSWPATKE